MCTVNLGVAQDNLEFHRTCQVFSTIMINHNGQHALSYMYVYTCMLILVCIWFTELQYFEAVG